MVAVPISSPRAIYDGADYIVVGRPIRMAVDPVETANEIAKEIEKALRDRGNRV